MKANYHRYCQDFEVMVEQWFLRNVLVEASKNQKFKFPNFEQQLPNLYEHSYKVSSIEFHLWF